MEEETKGYNGARPEQGRQLSAERTGNTGQVGGDKVVRPAGVYRHPQNGAEVITQHDPLLGDGQARAAERAGFVYLREAKPGEIKELGTPSEHYAAQPERAVEAQSNELASLRARLAALEAQEDRRRNEDASGNPVPGTEPVLGAERTKEAAAERTELQTGVKVDTKTGDVETGTNDGEGSTEHDQDDDEPSFKELQAEAKELGVSAKGSKEELTQRIAEAKAEKGNE